MKKILLLAAVMCFISYASYSQNSGSRKQGIVFETGTFSEILERAGRENKLVFLDAYTSWCGPCKRMASEVFTDKAVGEYFNATFINAKFDMEKGEGIELAKRYNVTRYPTFLLLDANGEVKATVIGGSPPKEFINRIKKAVGGIEAR